MNPVACAICGGQETRRRYTKFDFGIEECQRCGLVYANPRAPEEAIHARYTAEYFWDEYLPAVGAAHGRVDLDWLDARHGPMLALIRRHAPHARRLLEVGSGAGLFLKAAERGGFEVAGLELSPEGSRFARERLGLDVREERAEQMSFPPASFDVAVMFDVIEHLFDPRAVLHATGRALRPGGILLVGTPNLNAFSRFALGRDWAVLSPLEHTYYFTAATLRALLHSCGYSPVTFAREYPGLDPAATMNFRYTHAPHGWRSRVYGLFVRTAGTMLHPVIQAAGLGDALLAIARTTPQAGAAG